MSTPLRVHVGNDHGGVALRNVVCDVVRMLGGEVVSLHGPASADESVDYPDIAATVCQAVLADPLALGLLICGSGQGVAMAANRHAGIRAGVVADTFSARMIKEHNDANVLCLGARVVGPGLAEDLVRAFLQASFSQGDRHRRRVDKIEGLARQRGGDQ